MAAAKGRKAATPKDGAGQDGPPPFYIATEQLPVGSEMGAATMPVVAFQPGDRVPAEHVERYGWQAYVQPPGDNEDQDGPPPLPSETAAVGPDTGAPPLIPDPPAGGDPPPDDPAADGADSSKEKP